MKKRLVLSVCTVLAASLLIGAGTFAYFSAKTNASTDFVSGSISITAQRDSSDPFDGPMFYTTVDDGQVLTGLNAGMKGIYPDGYLKPGFESKFKTLVITNKGTITPILNKVSAQYLEGDKDLANALQVEVYRIPNITEPPVEIYKGNLATLLNGPTALNQEIPVEGQGTVETWAFRVKFPESNTPQNQYQGKSLKVKFLVHARS